MSSPVDSRQGLREETLVRWARNVATTALIGTVLLLPLFDQTIEILVMATIARILMIERKGKGPIGRNAVPGLGLAIVIAVARGSITWWVPLLCVGLIIIIPWLLGVALSLVQAVTVVDSETPDPDGRWMLWMILVGRLRMTGALAVWSASGVASDWREALLALPSAFAVGLGRPATAAVLLAVAAVVEVETLPNATAAALIGCVVVSRATIRPPRRELLLATPGRISSLSGPGRAVRRARRRMSQGDWTSALDLLDVVDMERPSELSEFVALHRARCQLEIGRPQQAIDSLRLAVGSLDPTRRCQGLRLLGESVAMANRPLKALSHFQAAARLSVQRSDRAAIGLGAAIALLDIGRTAEAAHEATQAVRNLRGSRLFAERIRAGLLLARARFADGDLAAARDAAGICSSAMLSTRWSRTFLSYGGRQRDDSGILFSGAAPVLAEILRSNLFDAVLALDPRSEKSVEEINEVLDDLDEVVESFRILDMKLDCAEAELLLARCLAGRGREKQALYHSLGALLDLDEVRHSLRDQRARGMWAARFSEALEQALDYAFQAGDPALLAELIEMARIQAIPTLGSDGQTDDFILQNPPTVRVRGRSRLVRRTGPNHEVPPVADIESAAASAAGPGAWWLSYWATEHWLYWAAVPSAGEITHGRILLVPGSDLANQLDQLRDALPVPYEGEGDGAFDVRVTTGPLMSAQDEEVALSIQLGRLLVPAAIRDALADASEAEPVRLAISPAGPLAGVPWSLLAIRWGPQTVRLVERAEWSLSASAGLLSRRSTQQTPDSPAPLRLAVLDPVDAPPEYPSLPAAHDLKQRLPESVALLGGKHWHDNIATVDSVVEHLRALSADSSVIFGCHAIRAIEGASATSGIVLAARSADGADVLSAKQVIEMGGCGSFPRQVALQACDTSDLASVDTGEWMTLAPAFVAAGAQSVLTTLFPLLDAPSSESDPILESLIVGDDLARAVRNAQLDGLRRWMTVPADDLGLSELPVYWGALALCCAGRGDSRPDTPPEMPERLRQCLHEAAELAEFTHDHTVTSSHFAAAYVMSQTEILESSWFLASIGAAWSFAVAKLSKPSGIRRPQSLAISPELEGIVRRAADDAHVRGAVVEPEDVFALIKADPKSPGSRFLRWSGMGRRRALVGTMRLNLLESVFSEAPRTHTAGDGSIADVFARNVVDSIAGSSPKLRVV